MLLELELELESVLQICQDRQRWILSPYWRLPNNGNNQSGTDGAELRVEYSLVAIEFVISPHVP